MNVCITIKKVLCAFIFSLLQKQILKVSWGKKLKMIVLSGLTENFKQFD